MRWFESTCLCQPSRAPLLTKGCSRGRAAVPFLGARDIWDNRVWSPIRQQAENAGSIPACLTIVRKRVMLCLLFAVLIAVKNFRAKARRSIAPDPARAGEEELVSLPALRLFRRKVCSIVSSIRVFPASRLETAKNAAGTQQWLRSDQGGSWRSCLGWR